MSEPVCDQKRLASHFYQKTCMGVPLRYNKDKRKSPVFSRVSASRLLCVHTIDTLFSCVDSIVYKKTPRPASRAAHVEPSAMPERGVRFSGHALVVGERRIQFECEYGCDQARAFDEPLDAVHTPSCSMVLRTSASIWSKRLHHGAPLLPWINGTPACWSRLA